MPLSAEARKASSERMKARWELVRAGKLEAPTRKKATEANGAAALPPAKAAPARRRAPVSASTAAPQAVESSPPVLTLHQCSGVFILRTFGSDNNSLVVAVARSLPSGSDLLIVTPTDTKQFKLGGSHVPQHRTEEYQDSAPNTTAEEQPPASMPEDDFEHDPQAEAQALAAEEERQQQVAGAARAADQAETAADRRRALTDLRRAEGEKGSSATACGRCQGTGQVMVGLPSGQQIKGACSVCSGSGQVARFGVRR